MDNDEAQRAVAWLCDAQNPDGGWGAPLPPLPAKKGQRQEPRFISSVEETALALEALLSVRTIEPHSKLQDVLSKGLQWLADTVEANQHGECSPIGFYFAKLWYYEKLYPLIFTTAALGTAVARMRREEGEQRLTPAMAGTGDRRPAPTART